MFSEDAVFYDVGKFPLYRYPPFNRPAHESPAEVVQAGRHWQAFAAGLRPQQELLQFGKFVPFGDEEEKIFELHDSSGRVRRVKGLLMLPPFTFIFYELAEHSNVEAGKDSTIFFASFMVSKVFLVEPLLNPFVYDRQGVFTIGPFATTKDNSVQALWGDIYKFLSEERKYMSEMAECEVVDEARDIMLVRFSPDNVKRARRFMPVTETLIAYVEVGEDGEFLWGQEVQVFFFGPTLKAYLPSSNS